MGYKMDRGFDAGSVVAVKEVLGDFEQSVISDIIYSAYIRGDNRTKAELIRDFWKSQLN